MCGGVLQFLTASTVCLVKEEGIQISETIPDRNLVELKLYQIETLPNWDFAGLKLYRIEIVLNYNTAKLKPY